MILTQLPSTGVWVFRDAEILVEVGGHYTHESREAAVSRANEAGLLVDNDGTVTPRQKPAGRL